MFINNQTLARGWAKTKRVIGDTWNHGVKIAQSLDHGMSVGKRLLGALTPLLDQWGHGKMIQNTLMSGISAYDQSRSDVIHGYNNVQSNLQRIRRAVPEINL